MRKTAQKTLKSKYLQDKEQAELHEQYQIEDEQVVIVERKSRVVNVVREVLKALFLFLRITATIAVVLLAIIGLAALVFAETRALLFEYFVQALSELTRNFQ